MWSVGSILTGLVTLPMWLNRPVCATTCCSLRSQMSFMSEDTQTTGSLQSSREAKQALAAQSLAFNVKNSTYGGFSREASLLAAQSHVRR